MTAGYVDPNALNIAHGDLSKRKKVQERASLQRFSIGLNNTTNSIKQSIRWQRVKWDLVKLYPNIIFDKNNNPNRSPTPEEVALAYHKFGIKFDHQHGIVEMIWKANQYRHSLPMSKIEVCYVPEGVSSVTFLRA
ncbi:hypothetical protein MJO28_002798 [Puccinia striiformis f. sp. tritici]|uniref:Uncharacterized protein n=1 Tax=Puccinia striiformis f. sp. tritici TaxID=168172 RepID=A0ACC0EQV1_9BASI|nr:hypothetical protein MJO28_002798 [Puccinia striiformis f. sp. tritici]